MFNKRLILLCALLGVITLALYWPAKSFNFIYYDDDGYIFNNPKVTQGLTCVGIDWAFQTFYGANWHPLTWISHMLDCQMYGLWAGGHHLTNVLLHSFNAMLLFWVLFQMTGAVWRSWIVAALFAWHPAHVESVAWVAERKDVLSTFFGLLSMLAYAFYVREPGRKNSSTIYYMAALFCFALSMLAKPMLVTMPFVLLLLDFWPFRRLQPAAQSEGATRAGTQPLGFGALLMEKLPFFALVFVSCIMTIWAQDSEDAILSNSSLPLLPRAAHALIAYVKYISVMLWPAKLAFFYPYPETQTLLHAGVAFAVLLALSATAWQWLRDAPYFAVGWFWFLGTLVPVIGIVQVGGQAMADRYTYFPYIGLFIALVWGGSEIGERGKLSRMALNIGVGVMLAACLAATSIQLQYWRNSFTLCDHALKVTQRNFVADCILAEYMEQQGKYDEAIEYAKSSLSYRPDYFPARNFLGIAYLESGRLDQAVASLSEAVRLRPDFPGLYHKLGRALFLQGRLDEALAQFSTAVQMNPSDFASESQMGAICAQKKDFSGAILHYQTALAVNPNCMEALNNLAWIRAANRNPEFRNGAEAVRLAKRACDTNANKEPVLLGTLAAAYAEAGDFNNAVSTASQAREIALAANKKDVADRNQQLLELYRSGRAYHEGEGQ